MKLRLQYPREYSTWSSMKQRCENPNNVGYENYGGRGIKVCERWLNSFENFIADMGPRPEKHSIERIDNNRGYEPDNCKWATAKEQAQNQRIKRSKSFKEWEKKRDAVAKYKAPYHETVKKYLNEMWDRHPDFKEAWDIVFSY